MAYWVSENVIKTFEYDKIGDVSKAKPGLQTGCNELFVRLWYEVIFNKMKLDAKSISESVISQKKWFPYNKGGDYRKWYGNNEFIVNWEHDGNLIRNFKNEQGKLRSVSRNTDYYFKESFSWSLITSGGISFRYKPNGFIFDVAGMSCFTDKNLEYFLALCNTPVVDAYMKIIAPTINYQAGDIAKIPVIFKQECNEQVTALVKENISFSKSDWDAFETSWDFTKHPLLRNKSTISEAYSEWEAECNTRFSTLKANEEELNRIFINIYGLQDELTPEVEDKDVTVRKADLQRDIKSLLSYAVGCMFGRYSLDVEGLAYAGGEWDESKYVTFKPDEDNVIPITDEDYFEDDIIGRLIAWLKVVYGAETLEENLRFIADALGTSGDTARQKIRNYFLKDFFKDHCKIYQKRPIYWLYDSGKQNGFKALIYMHRYNADTSGQVRAEYLGKMEETYESEINRMQDIMDNGAGREVALAGKRKEKLQKQLHECRDYDAVLGHIALASIAIDLDDGVKVNYVKVQTAKDGKLLPILAKI